MSDQGDPRIGDCPLCQTKNTVRKESHILPKWAYKRARDSRAKNPNPMVVADGTAIQTSKQITEYMLCDNCEQLLGRDDNWASRALYQEDGSAPLVQRSTRERDALVVSDEDADALVRFCLSVIWRGHHAKDLATDLGPYADSIRDYLYGSGPVPDAVVPIVCFYECSPGKTDYAAMLFTPVTNHNKGYHLHRFVLFGIDALIGVGGRVPGANKRLCLARSKPRRVVLSKSEQVVEFVGGMFAEAVRWRRARGFRDPQ
jgi:hypothetical protein